MKKYIFLCKYFFLFMNSNDILGASHHIPLSGAQEQQPINYKGTLIKTNGESFDVDNVSISGEIAKILFYNYPINASKNPKTDTELIDLYQVEKIQRDSGYSKESISVSDEDTKRNSKNRRKRSEASENSEQRIVTHNGRKYVEIIITFTTGVNDTYLIELSREIWCNRIETRTFKKVSFEVLDMLILENLSIQKEC